MEKRSGQCLVLVAAVPKTLPNTEEQSAFFCSDGRGSLEKKCRGVEKTKGGGLEKQRVGVRKIDGGFF